MKAVWDQRIGAGMASSFAAYAETTQEDLPYLAHDVAGSIAHVMGLHHVGLLEAGDAEALIAGLQGIHEAHAQGNFLPDPALEDVHMNIEASLRRQLGDLAKRLHTGRSRNDQVATCITLRARAGLVDMATACQGLAHGLTAQALQHATTPWVAKTHGQPAQPATLGYLFIAHALRLQKTQQQILDTFSNIGTSPLGCGAVAGSTLPLDPAFTAATLGLAAPENGLLATGTRDQALSAIEVAGQVGLHAASLAQDLLELFHDGLIALPAGFTTGSSLMPQKRNPDALELARGHGKALTAAPGPAMALMAGLGLGYQRDMQAIKPMLDEALHQATDTLQVLSDVVQGLHVDIEASVASLQVPGITATDALEAAVLAGLTFRDAYDGLGAAFLATEQGTPLAKAIQGLDWPPDAIHAALEALRPDPSRRDTLAGPSPEQVHVQAAAAISRATVLAMMLTDAKERVALPQRLITNAPGDLLP